jgi:hypothetical protein
MLFIWLILSILLAVIITGGSICYYNYIKQCKINASKMSFKEAMDLTELPVVTFLCGTNKLNFLLDTGSNSSYINTSILSNIPNKQTDLKFNHIGPEGNVIKDSVYLLEIKYKDKEYQEQFCGTDLNAAFSLIKEESGVQIHGILGNQFFEKHKYVLDFANLTAYTKK